MGDHAHENVEQCILYLRSFGYAVTKSKAAVIYSCGQGHNHRSEKAVQKCEYNASRKTGYTVYELAKKMKEASATRYLAAYSLWCTGIKMKDVAQEFGVSASRARSMILKGYSYATKDGSATRVP